MPTGGRAATGRIAVTGIGLPGPSSAFGQRRRAMANCGAVRARHDHGSAQLPGVARAAPELSPCGLPPGHVAACSRRGRDRLVNRPDLAGQRARVGAARRRPDVRAGEPWVEDATAVVTGHGPETEIGWEKDRNQFVRA